MIILVIGNIKHLNHTPYSQEAVHVHIGIYCTAYRVVKMK